MSSPLSPLSASSTQCGHEHCDPGCGPPPAPSALGDQHAPLAAGCPDVAEPRAMHPDAAAVKGLMAQQEAAFVRLLARTCGEDGSPAQDRNAAGLRFAESWRACKAAVSRSALPACRLLRRCRPLAVTRLTMPCCVQVDEVFGSASASAEWHIQVPASDGGARSADAKLAQGAHAPVVGEAHPACSRLKLRAQVRSWRSLVLRKQDRQSVLHYAETLYHLNLIRRAMHSFVGCADTRCTEHVACQTTPPKSQTSAAAALQPVPSGPLRGAVAASVLGNKGLPGTSPNAKAKVAIKKKIRLTRTISPGAPDAATGRALSGGNATHGRDIVQEHPMEPGAVADRERTAEPGRSCRMSTMPRIPRCRGNFQTQVSAKRENKDSMAQATGTVRVDQLGKLHVAEDAVKRDQRRHEREKLLRKVEVMEARLLREISALDAQVRATDSA